MLQDLYQYQLRRRKIYDTIYIRNHDLTGIVGRGIKMNTDSELIQLVDKQAALIKKQHEVIMGLLTASTEALIFCAKNGGSWDINSRARPVWVALRSAIDKAKELLKGEK